MTKEDLISSFAATAKAIFDATDVFVANGWSKVGELSDDTSLSRLGQIEPGKSYLIVSVAGSSTKESPAEGKKVLREGKTIAVNLLEAETGTPCRVYLGTLQRNVVAATKNKFNGTMGLAKTNVNKFLTVTDYQVGERKADNSRDIKINYSVVDNI